MVKRKRPVKKDKGIPTKLPDGSPANLDLDAKTFREEYDVWERKAEGLTGDEIGMISPEAVLVSAGRGSISTRSANGFKVVLVMIYVY